MMEELMEKSVEELRAEVEAIFKAEAESSMSHMYTYFGGLGVSPNHMKMYADSLAAIEKYKNRL